MNRRKFICYTMAKTIAPFLVTVSSKTAQANAPYPYKVFPVAHIVDLPVGGCADIKKQIVLFNKQLVHVKSNQRNAGKDMLAQVSSLRLKLLEELAEIDKKTKKNQHQSIIAGVGLIAGLILMRFAPSIALKLGIPALGVAAGGSLMIGQTQIIAHAATFGTETKISHISAYTKDKFLMLGNTTAEEVLTHSGKLISKAITIITSTLVMVDIYSQTKEINQARRNSEQITVKIKEFDELLKNFGKSSRRWGNLKKHLLQSTISALENHVENTKHSNCMDLNFNNIPQIKRTLN